MDPHPFLFALFLAISYIVGSVPFGRIIVWRTAGMDVTKQGSGNIGATNVARAVGLKWGALTLLLDMLKGMIPLTLFRFFFEGSDTSALWVGLSALLGHQFSLFMGLKGGKGVATALGVYLIMTPLPCCAALVLFVLTVRLTRFISLGSMLAACSIPVLLWVFSYPEAQLAASLLMAGLICLKHGQNIRRLLEGKENAWRRRPS